MKGRSYVVSILFALGLLGVFVGERLIGTGTSRGVFTGLGLALVLAALVGRWLRRARAQGDARHAESVLFWMYLVGVVALGLYFLQSDLMDKAFTSGGANAGPGKLRGALAALWPAVMAASVFPVLLIEFAYASMAMAALVELGRIRDALWAGLGLGFAVVFAFSASYVAEQRDGKVDLSYFRTAKPGDATRKVVRGLDEPVNVALFFPPANEVHQEVKEYFTDLAKESAQLKLSDYDQAVDVAKAKELGVSGNGAIVLSRGGRREQMLVGLRLEQSRSQLRNLDAEIQRRLLAVAKARRVIYLTTGHGERSEDKQLATDQRGTIRGLKEVLRAQNYELRNFSAADGLATEVPKDAAAILILGPTSPFLPEEVQAVNRYLANGGRALIALDPEAGLEFKDVLAPLGMKFNPVMLANDAVYARRVHQVSDKTNIATASFSSHPSTTSLSQLGGRAPMVLFGAGSLEVGGDRSTTAADFTVHAHTATWNDLNGNFEFDGPMETRKPWELAAAIVKHRPGAKDEEQGRAIVLADSDALTDGLVDNPNFGNAYFLVDGMKWLLGDEATAGTTTSEVDVPIEHTRKQDVVWFYSTIFLVPAAMLGVGFVLTRRASRPRASANVKERR